MKKRIVSILLLGVYFFGGFGMVFAQTYQTDRGIQVDASAYDRGRDGNITGVKGDGSSTFTPLVGTSDNTDTKTSVNADWSTETTNSDGTSTRKNTDGSTTTFDANGDITSSTAANGDKTTFNADGTSTKTPASSSSPSGGPNDMTSTSFSLNPNDLSPSEKKYTGGTNANLKAILTNIGKYLLIATTTIAVLSIVVGGLMIATTGPTDRAAKGKTIIMLNITAVIIALFSYSIIRLVSWLIA